MKLGKGNEKKVVLVSVLKNRKDQWILLQERWYRIPVESLPKRKFKYIAFYQPAVFGKQGRMIEYYAKVWRKKVCKRIKPLPKEKNHPRAKENYVKIEFREIRKLPRPVKNIIPRRISFGFTTLGKLLSARDILGLYGVPPLEQVMDRGLKCAGIKAVREFPISVEGKRFRLDLAILGGKKPVAVECDNKKAHAGKIQKHRDKIKDTYLRAAGWRVIRLKEKDIVLNLDACVGKIQKVLGRKN